jgi:hypothetical protein
VRVLAFRMAAAEEEAKNREQAAGLLASQLEASQRALAAQREQMATEVERATRERHKRQRVEDENKVRAPSCCWPGRCCASRP